MSSCLRASITDTFTYRNSSPNQHTFARSSLPSQHSRSPLSRHIPPSYLDRRSHKINYVATDWNNNPLVSSDEFCTNCNRFCVPRPEYCPVLHQMMSLRRQDTEPFKHRAYVVHIDGGAKVPMEPDSDPILDFAAIDNFEEI